MQIVQREQFAQPSPGSPVAEKKKRKLFGPGQRARGGRESWRCKLAWLAQSQGAAKPLADSEAPLSRQNRMKLLAEDQPLNPLLHTGSPEGLIRGASGCGPIGKSRDVSDKPVPLKGRYSRRYRLCLTGDGLGPNPDMPFRGQSRNLHTSLKARVEGLVACCCEPNICSKQEYWAFMKFMGSLLEILTDN
ncbi:hypothetical protein NDU88_002853 [Pleurodeles waltl]|uniref:Uncharacterized protein n=1 Tax=Pleurodeles waltl TaxID=8319 RepID=A0AAV7M2V6_PLEWA|nr:hypothetical protein NDU88_002853 [Pleurodeles waltl]